MGCDERGGVAGVLSWGVPGVTAESQSGFSLPTGTVAFLLTDVEGSTRGWEADPDLMAQAMERHAKILVEPWRA